MITQAARMPRRRSQGQGETTGRVARIRRNTPEAALSVGRNPDILAARFTGRPRPLCRLCHAWEGSSCADDRIATARLARLEPARVCIIKPSSLGDVVHALPILAALRVAGQCPSGVGRGPAFPGAARRPPFDLDELIVYDRSARAGDFLGLRADGGIVPEARRGRFDLTIDLQGLLRSALMTAATRARVRVGHGRCARRGTVVLHRHRRCLAAASARRGTHRARVPRPWARAWPSRGSTCRSRASDSRWARETLLRAAVARGSCSISGARG